MSEILEGFLCPLCMKDLGDVIQLQIHFEENHSKEDQAFLQSIKDLFGKAKKKILSDEEQIDNAAASLTPKVKFARSDDNIHPVSGIRTDLFPTFRLDDSFKSNTNSSHFNYLKKIRSERVDRYAAETNRLIVRLDRLLDNMPTDTNRRRLHEQTIVDWIDESLVKLCPTCTRGFNIARRKHHCRLCGSVMCKDCSKFVEWSFCRKLINPSTLSIYSMKTPERQGWSVSGSIDSGSVGVPSSAKGSRNQSLLRRSGSKESLLSVSEPRNTEEFRVCEYCNKLLVHRDAAIDLQTNKPILTQFYDKLKTQMNAGADLSEQYSMMYESLLHGDTTYHLEDAKTVRLKLLKIGESVDLISKKISELGKPVQGDNDDSQVVVNSRRFFLQNQIRRASVNFIKDTLVGLPSLPSDEKLADLRKLRQEETARRVEQERRKAREAKIRFQNLQEKRQESGRGRLPHSKSDQSIKYEKGFVLSSSGADETEVLSSDDPMIQQMNIIRNYIKRAREANRYDEVGTLESNLSELQIEYQRMQQERHLQHDQYQQTQSSQASHNSNQYSEGLNPFLCSDENEEGRGDTEDVTVSTETDSSSSQGTLSDAGLSSSHTSPAFNTYSKEVTTKPVLNEVASAIRNVRNNLSNKNILTNFNPFGNGESEDEYDASGKNPFSE